MLFIHRPYRTNSENEDTLINSYSDLDPPVSHILRGRVKREPSISNNRINDTCISHHIPTNKHNPPSTMLSIRFEEYM